MSKKIIFSLAILLCVNFAWAQHDSVFTKRMAGRNGAISIPYTHDVRPYIETLVKNRNLISTWLYYKPEIDAAFEGINVPAEFKSFAIIASGMSATMVDEHTNAGWWLMPFGVAKAKGLKINSYVDERMDLQKSSAAFAREMSELYGIYKDWQLVLAAYASSSSAVNKAIRESGSKMRYKDIAQFLPEYAQKIVHMFSASVYYSEFYREHGISVVVKTKPAIDSARIAKWTPLDEAAQKLRMQTRELEELNPIFRKKLVPPALSSYYLKFPADKAVYKSALDSISFSPYSIDDYMEEIPELPNKNIPIANKDSLNSDSISSDSTAKVVEPIKNEEQTVLIIYKVKAGDGLYSIANKYGVTIENIRSWNKIKNNTIYPGQKLKIYRKKKG